MNMIKHFINRIARLTCIKRRMYIAPNGSEVRSVSISYAVMVCNEAKQLRTLLDLLQQYCQKGDEIVVQADRKNVSKEVKQVVKDYKNAITTYIEHELNFDFAQAKNHLNEQCHGDWIFQLDADECPPVWLMEHLRGILQANEGVELYKVPRLNLFVNESGETDNTRVAWPDYQGRIYRNSPQKIRWKRPLHERIYGHKAYVYLPKDEAVAIRHIKVKAQDLEKWSHWKEQYK